MTKNHLFFKKGSKRGHFWPFWPILTHFEPFSVDFQWIFSWASKRPVSDTLVSPLSFPIDFTPRTIIPKAGQTYSCPKTPFLAQVKGNHGFDKQQLPARWLGKWPKIAENGRKWGNRSKLVKIGQNRWVSGGVPVTVCYVCEDFGLAVQFFSQSTRFFFEWKLRSVAPQKHHFWAQTKYSIVLEKILQSPVSAPP